MKSVNRCTCGKSTGVKWGTADGHSLDCHRGPGQPFYIDATKGVGDLLPPNPIGVKYDSEKPRVDLLIDGCPLSLEAISQVLTFGSKKYADHNWQHVEGGEQRYKAALMRHVLASAKGEKVDSETGLSHLAHAACCVLFMLELELKKDA